MSTTTAAALSCSGDICVDPTGWQRDGGAFNVNATPIQAAVDNATAGETVCVAAGSYTEKVDIATAHLTLRGEGAGVVTVTAASSGEHVFHVTADCVNISGFTVTGATGTGGAGIRLINRQYCNISENTCSNNYWGIFLRDSSSNTLANNNVHSNSHFGIFLYDSSGNTLANNNVHSNDDYGIRLYSSSNGNTLLGNTVNSNDDGIYMSSLSNGNTLASNNVSSNNDYGINLCGSCSNTLVDNNAISNKYGIVMYTSCNNNMIIRNSCSNNTYHGIGLLGLNNTCVDNNCSNNYCGIDMYSSSNSTITGNKVSNNHCGIDVSSSSNNTFESNDCSNSYCGIEMSSSSNNMLMNNTANSNTAYGIRLSGLSNGNTLASNDCSDNKYGIYTTSSSDNTLLNNTVNSNTEYGIYLYYSSNDNLIYNNYFDNSVNAYDTGINQWNTTKTNGTNIIGGPFLGGNYWSDYAGVDNTGDGLGDTMLPYNSAGKIQNGGDLHPLILLSYNCTCGDICVDETGWWRDGGAFNANTTPIQAAVSNANAGEAICVAAGSYTENVDITTPHLTLAGEGAGVVTVTAADSSDHVFEVTADYVNISGFTATGAGWPYAGIHLYGADHCNISENNASNNLYGIYLTTSSNNMLVSNTASNNYYYGIHLSSSSNNMLVSNTASNNCCGIHMYSSSNYNTLTSNTANSNDWDGIHVYSSRNNTLTSNTANSNNDDGINLNSSSSNTLTSNTANSNNDNGIFLYSSCDNDVTCNLVQNNTDCGIRLTSGSTGNNIARNNIIANGELQTDGSYHYQFKNSQSDDANAINNFWGAGMNNSTIDASIYDDEGGRAEVEFYPFETEPVPCAPVPISEESPAFTTVDAVIALRIAVGSCPLDLYWDVSGDGQVTSLDALMILGGTGTG